MPTIAVRVSSAKLEPDAWAVGHVTLDRIVAPNRPIKEQFGGSAYYVALAWAALGWRAGIVTRMAEGDAERLRKQLEPRGVRLVNHACAATTAFENRYEDEALARRIQSVTGIADPFAVAHVEALSADAFHLGPLTADELPTDVLRAVVDKGARVSFDAQGDLRRVDDQRVVPARMRDVAARLSGVTALKVDDAEASMLVGDAEPRSAARALAAHGVAEVLVTFADRGALVCHDETVAPIPPVPPREHVDATGCGDTFVASYAFGRGQGMTPVEAAGFAASAASLKLEGYGPLSASADHVRANLRRVRAN